MLSKDIAAVDENIKLTATATGGKPPTVINSTTQKDGDPAEVLIRNYSTTRTATFAPDAPGTYVVHLEITDNDKGTDSFDTSKTLNLTSPVLMNCFSAGIKSTLALQSPKRRCKMRSRN